MGAAKNPARSEGESESDFPRATLWSVAYRVMEKADDDNLFSIGAQLAFYFLLGLFPFLLLVFTLLPYLSSPDLLESIRGFARPFVPPGIFSFVIGNLEQMLQEKRHGLLSLSVITLLWSASGSFRSIISGLNAAYDVDETRPFWRTRLNAMGLTIALGLVAIIGTSLLAFGKILNAFAVEYVPIPIVVWILIRWVVALLFLMLTLDIVYYAAPNVRHPWRWFNPGAIVATPIWVAMSVGYAFYVSRFGRHGQAHGSDALAAIITLMLWFYLSGVVLLIGGELNSILDRRYFRDVEILAGPWRWRRRKPQD